MYLLIVCSGKVKVPNYPNSCRMLRELASVANFGILNNLCSVMVKVSGSN